MKQIKLKLTGNEAIALNDPVFIEKDEKIEFIITNGNGELFYSDGVKNHKAIEGKFILHNEDLKTLEKLNIIEKRADEAYPKLYKVVLKRHDITVLGATVDEKYPDVIKDLYNQIETLGKAVIDLYDRLDEKEREGVIESE